MKKFLMLSAAALLLSAVAANAGTTVIRLDKTLDTFRITQGSTVTMEGPVFAQVHFYDSHQVGAGVGMEAKTKYIGKSVMITDVQQNSALGVKYVCYDFQRPFKNGGEWDAYFSYDGRRVQWLGSGTYTVLSTSNH